jgi:hypothetical protein
MSKLKARLGFTNEFISYGLILDHTKFKIQVDTKI